MHVSLPKPMSSESAANCVASIKIGRAAMQPGENCSSAPPLLIDEREARRLLGGVSAKSLFNWRRDLGLPFVRLGTRIMYSPIELQHWIDQRKTSSSLQPNIQIESPL